MPRLPAAQRQDALDFPHVQGDRSCHDGERIPPGTAPPWAHLAGLPATLRRAAQAWMTTTSSPPPAPPSRRRATPSSTHRRRRHRVPKRGSAATARPRIDVATAGPLVRRPATSAHLETRRPRRIIAPTRRPALARPSFMRGDTDVQSPQPLHRKLNGSPGRSGNRPGTISAAPMRMVHEASSTAR